MMAVELWIQFMSGAFMLASAAVALFFLEYWRKTGERLFAILGLAFMTFAVERIFLAYIPASYEGRHWIYLARFFAFILIIAGIIDKNRSPRRGGKQPPLREERTTAKVDALGSTSR
jgi:uncharacterized membrane protein HdeD (DUF308 family)